jgi:hypothetical protein
VVWEDGGGDPASYPIGHRENGMIIVRPEEVGDQQGIETVRADATATLRRAYRPSQKAIADKARISASLKRLVAVANGQVVGTVQYYIENKAVRAIGLGVHTDYRRKGICRSIIHHLQNIGSFHPETAFFSTS